jgi:hypothetical protein
VGNSGIYTKSPIKNYLAKDYVNMKKRFVKEKKWEKNLIVYIHTEIFGEGGEK